jgi:predicted permease
MRLWNRVRHLFKQSQFERDLQEEVRIHREMADANERRLGTPDREAHHTAVKTFGSELRTLEDSRSAWGFVWLESLFQDIRYALRSFRRTPIFAFTVIVTIGLALGLNTALFTAFNAYVLSPFAVQDPYSLYEFSWNSRAVVGHGFSWREFQQIRENNPAFVDAFAFRRADARMNGETLVGLLVTGDYFSMLGITPALGRTLVPSDVATPGTNAVVVLSHSAWQSKFGGDPGVIGKIIPLQGHPFEIAGVARRGFAGLSNPPPDFWAPMTMYSQLAPGPDLFLPVESHPLDIIGRLRPNLFPAQAKTALLAYMTELTADHNADDQAISVNLQSSATSVPLTLETIAEFSPAFIALGLVLLLACANVANMLLARALARQREIGVRLALGAARRRLVRQLVTEGFVLAVPAAALGYVLAWVGVHVGERAFFAVIPSEFAAHVRVIPIELDYRVFAFILTAACLSTLAFGLAPALQATRGDLVRAIRGEFTDRHRAGRLRNGLVIAQVAVCVLLLICAGILLRGGKRVEAVSVGLDVHGVIDLDVRQGFPRVASSLDSDRSVESRAAVWRTPLYGTLRPVHVIPEGSPDAITAGHNFVSPEYFDIFRLPIIHGRNFTADEARSEAPVVILSEATSKRLWPNQDALGKTIRIQPPPDPKPDKFPMYANVRVIGIAADVISGMVVFGTDPTCIYFPTGSDGNGAGVRSFVVRVKGNTEVVRRSLDSKLSSEIPGAISQITPMEQVLDAQYLTFRLFGWISEALGALALILTVAGIYGVISYLVSERKKEIGIRMALGASDAVVVRMILAQSVKMAGIGLGIGALAALALARVLAAHIFMMNAFEVVAFGGGIGLVLTATAAAAFVPARRASRVDPNIVLRYD